MWSLCRPSSPQKKILKNSSLLLIILNLYFSNTSNKQHIFKHILYRVGGTLWGSVCTSYLKEMFELALSVSSL
jgi:hypothetical protein